MGEVWTALGLSLGVAALATVGIALPAVWVGTALARGRGWWRTPLETVSMAPLVLPPVVTGYALLVLLGPRGPLSGLWNAVGGSPAFTTAACVLASAVVSFPLFVRSVRQAVEAVDPGLEEAAATLGASRFRIWREVTWPLSRGGLIAGAVLAFARSLGEFGATIVVAGNIAGQTRTLPLALYRWLQVPGGESRALVLAGVSVLLAVGTVAISEWLSRRSA